MVQIKECTGLTNSAIYFILTQSSFKPKDSHMSKRFNIEPRRFNGDIEINCVIKWVNFTKKVWQRLFLFVS